MYIYKIKSFLSIYKSIYIICSICTYRNHEGYIYLAWFPLLLLAVDDLDVSEGEVVQAVLVVVPHHPAVVHARVPENNTKLFCLRFYSWGPPK